MQNNPSKGEVAAPTVRRDRDAAIEREMQFYGYVSYYMTLR